jgi:integrase
MAGRQAKIITADMERCLLARVKRSRTPVRDQVLVLLSLKAGLRACEIAGLDWDMVLGPRGEVGDTLHVRDHIAKKGSGRRVPMHRELRAALRALRAVSGTPGPVIRSARGGAMRANSIVNWFVVLFAELGFEGCSSHSGRRSFITRSARNLARTGGSLRDIQLLAGHASIETTQRYIDGDSKAQRQLIRLL